MYLINHVISRHKPYSHPPVKPFVSGPLACKKNWTKPFVSGPLARKKNWTKTIRFRAAGTQEKLNKNHSFQGRWHARKTEQKPFVSGPLARKKNWTKTTSPNLNQHKITITFFPCMNSNLHLFSCDLYCKYVRHCMDIYKLLMRKILNMRNLSLSW